MERPTLTAPDVPAPTAGSDAPAVSRRARTSHADVLARSPQVAMQAALPFDDEADRPIGYALTPNARRIVAPGPVARLRVVPPAAVPPATAPCATVRPVERASAAGADAAVDPHDIRPARARAMRRAGHDPEVIALRLAVAPEEVMAWIAEIGPIRTARPGRRVRGARTVPDDGDATVPTTAVVIDGAARRAAAREVAGRIGADAGLARDLGLIAGGARPTGATVAIGLTDVALASAVLGRLRSDAGLEAHGVRVVLRVGPARSADRARHEWAEVLRLPLERTSAVRWPLAADPEDVEATVHLVAPDVVARVLGWIDAITAGAGDLRLRESS